MAPTTEARPEAGGMDQFTFTSEQVIKLSGITRRKLGYWIDTKVIRPSVDAAGRRGSVRLFSFSDLVEIRSAVWLRDVLSLQLIRKVVERLRTEGLAAPLAEVSFGIFESGNSSEQSTWAVVMQRPDGSWESARMPGQLVMQLTIPVGRFADELTRDVLDGRRRGNRVGKVERRRGTMGSVPVLAGTRVPTKAVWNLHASGMDVQQILKSYPGLDPADVEAAIREESSRRTATA